MPALSTVDSHHLFQAPKAPLCASVNFVNEPGMKSIPRASGYTQIYTLHACSCEILCIFRAHRNEHNHIIKSCQCTATQAGLNRIPGFWRLRGAHFDIVFHHGRWTTTSKQTWGKFEVDEALLRAGSWASQIPIHILPVSKLTYLKLIQNAEQRYENALLNTQSLSEPLKTEWVHHFWY